MFKLGLIENRIKTEVNTRKNDKHIQNLKTGEKKYYRNIQNENRN